MRAAFRRAANHTRKYDPCIMIARGSYANNPIASTFSLWFPNRESLNHHHIYGLFACFEKLFFGTFFNNANSNLTSRRFSSQAGKMTIQMLNEGGFSDSEANLDSNKKVDLPAEINIEQSVQVELSETDSKANSAVPAANHSKEKDEVSSSLLEVLMKAPHSSVTVVLNEWVKDGNTLDRGEISVAMIHLRKRKQYGKALQFVEWLESSKLVNFVERDYASHLDLVAKTNGLHEAEAYIDKVPEEFRGEVVYRTLLANCVIAVNAKKAEQVFSMMRDLGLSISSFSYNQLLLLYRRIDRRKIPDVLQMMEKDNTQPSLFTYMILIDAKGLSRDISGMEKILKSMKAEGIVETDNTLQAMVARHYISAGFNKEAEAILKEMEDDCGRESSDVWRFLLPLYASLCKVDDVKRLWKSREASACIDDFISAIEAYGKLGLINDAEKIFEKLTKKWEKVPPRSYNALLKVYADLNLVSKGKDLATKMSDAGCWIGPLTWDALVKLFTEAGEVEKAESVLLNADQRMGIRPLYSSYLTMLDKHAEQGNVHGAEKIFHRLGQAKYPRRVSQYQLLAKAYKNAKTPAYGLRERMRADNVYPNKKFSAELLQLTNL